MSQDPDKIGFPATMIRHRSSENVGSGSNKQPGVNSSYPLFRRQNSEGVDRKRRIETRLLSLWHNVKFGWTLKTRTSFSKGSPVWLLGNYYHFNNSAGSEIPAEQCNSSTSGGSFGLTKHGIDEHSVEAFQQDFYTKIWMTYRKEFPAMMDTSYTTDCGWGCMLRSAQMMLAQALVVHFMGRAWRWLPDKPPQSENEIRDYNNHKLIIKWFADKQSDKSPFSIHELVKAGEVLGKKAGDWYGPASVSHIIKRLVSDAACQIEELKHISVLVTHEHTLYINDVIEHCYSEDGSWRSLIILIPMKLGNEKINPIYNYSLTSLLSTEYCIGVMGGRPKHSLYFVGFQDDKLIHLDPHYCQSVVNMEQANFPLNSFHCKTPRKMLLSKMDPSCCIGFYIANQSEFEKFVYAVSPYLSICPIFSILEEGSSSLNSSQYNFLLNEVDGNWTYVSNDSENDIESEEFIMV